MPTPARLRPPSFGLTAGLLLATTIGCEVLGPSECGAPHRWVRAQGSTAMAGDTAGVEASFAILQQRNGDAVSTTVSWTISSRLKPSVTGAELRDTQDGTLIAVLPLKPRLSVTTGFDVVISEGVQQPYSWSLPLDATSQRIGAGRVALDVRSSLTDRPLVRVPLQGTFEPWHRSPCPD